ncbi:hypothetical protein CI759_16910 [Shigella sonnei]|uniref:hypothetical protein n=1 Tax=Shigella sonnei TaxID=624 RepID=UPI000B9534C4|nr:hypothetical protein [Shigella sonnei]OYL90017.1 hypothetical protein CI759_16910 [Shigella sonnei]
MSTRRKINKTLKGKGLSADFIRLKLNEPEFTGVIEFCEIEDGLEQLSEMPSMATQEVPHDN